MANFLTEVYGQIGSVWKKLSIGQRVVILLVTAAMAMGVVGVIYWTSKIEMSRLFGNLPPEDASTIQAKLDDEGIPYELRDSGTSIFVPNNRVFELRNRLSPHIKGDGQGMEIFDNMQLGMTEFIQNVQYIRAKEGELARTIAWYEPVAAARVNITIPKPTIFTEEQQSATAGVVLKLVPGRSLTPNQVLAIAQLVAVTVGHGLSADSVRITDTNLRLLSKPMDDGEGQMAANQLDLKHSFEKSMTRKVQDRLDEVMGPGKVSVILDVDLDFQQKTEKKIEYSEPEGGKLVKSEKINTEDTKSAASKAGGPTGTEGRLQGTAPPAASAGPSSTKEDSEKEFAVNENHTDSIQAGASIKRISIAIMIDETLQAQETQITSIVQQAVGFVETRDSCETAVIKFSEPEPLEDMEGLESYEQKEFILTLARYGVQGLSVAAVLLILWVVFKKSEKKVAAARSRPSETVQALSQQRAELERQQVREEVVTAVRSDPLMASDILHEWLDEEEPIQ